MRTIACTFAGHREIYAADISERVDAAIESILRVDTDFTFYTGDMGAFDRICAGAVRRAQRAHPNLNSKLILVLPYLTESLHTNKAYYESTFDSILVPTELIGAHYKGAIQKRNRWMVNHSDYLIAYVRQNFGGAYQTLQYARRQPELTIVNLANEEKKPEDMGAATRAKRR